MGKRKITADNKKQWYGQPAYDETSIKAIIAQNTDFPPPEMNS